MTYTGYTQSEIDALLALRDAEIGALKASVAALEKRVTALEPKPLLTTLYVPMFIYPSMTGLMEWQKVADVKRANPQLRVVACMNPNNGVFTSANSDFTRGADLLKAAGVEVIGYVYTNYGGRPPADVKRCIDAYKRFYPQVSGIFFDEMNNKIGGEVYYSDLSDYAASMGYHYTMGNPGTSTTIGYVGTVDCILVYESAGLPNETTIKNITFEQPRSNFGLIPHTVTAYSTTWTEMAKKYCGMIYVTGDGADGNPWNSISKYLMQLAADLAAS